MGSLVHSTAPAGIGRSQIETRAAAGRAGRVRLLVLTDTDLSQRGGSERFLVQLLEGLDSKRFEIDLVQLAYSPPPGGRPHPLANGRDNLCIEHRPVGAIYGPRAWRVWRELRSRIRAGRYDIIQSQHEKADLLSAFLPGGSHPLLRISNRRDTGFQKGRVLRLLFLLINHRFDLFIAPSQAILKQLVAHEGVAPARTRCLPNGVNCEYFKPCQGSGRETIRAGLGLPPDAYLFGCAARLVPVKRHVDLLAGFARVARDHPAARLVLMGGGPLENELRRQAERAGIADRVRFLGECPNLELMLPLIDAFVLASSTEGMSNAVLEAMACALPVVATRVGGNPELIEHNRTGYLVPPFQPQALAAALSDLIERPDNARRMGQAGRRRAETTFSLAAMIDSFTTLYRARQPTVKP